jgi:hypothetical protein
VVALAVALTEVTVVALAVALTRGACPTVLMQSHAQSYIM